MQLKEYIKHINEEILEISGNIKIDICGVSNDSRNLKKSFIFIAISGSKLDANKFISQAITNKASVIISETPFLQNLKNKYPNLIFIKIKENTQYLVYSKLCDCYHNFPAKRMKAIGITGTNGKTTSAYLINYLLKKNNFKTGMIGTICYQINEKTYISDRTTPPADKFHYILDQMKGDNIDYLVTEVSSHSVDQDRISGVLFDYLIFTNLSGDHLDYHLTMENYYIAKKKLFTNYLKANGVAIINIDDKYGLRLSTELSCRVITYGFSKNADLKIINFYPELSSAKFTYLFQNKMYNVTSPLYGEFNVLNLAATLSVLRNIVLDFELIHKQIERFTGVPGRMQVIKTSNNALIFVDYAHTDDALQNVCSTLKNLNPKKLIVIFGCGGDRDKTKRPRMGYVASQLADEIIITADNSRSENTADILLDIEKGIRKSINYQKIISRYDAIKYAVEKLLENEILLIAGKGHEDYQEEHGTRSAFSDYSIALEFSKLNKK